MARAAASAVCSSAVVVEPPTWGVMIELLSCRNRLRSSSGSPLDVSRADGCFRREGHVCLRAVLTHLNGPDTRGLSSVPLASCEEASG